MQKSVHIQRWPLSSSVMKITPKNENYAQKEEVREVVFIITVLLYCAHKQNATKSTLPLGMNSTVK